MPVVVKHKKVSEVPDSADETIIQPSDWNEEHEITGAVSLEELNARLQDFSAENPADYNGVGFSYGMTSNGTEWNPGAFRVAKYTGAGIPLMDVLQMTDTDGRLSSGDPVNDFNTVNKRYLEQVTPTYRGILPVDPHDLNDYKEMGYWSQDRNVGAEAGLNYPLNKAGLLEVLVGYSSNITTVQRYTAYNDARSYVRMEGIPGTWSAWREELTTRGANDLGGYSSVIENYEMLSGKTIYIDPGTSNFKIGQRNGNFTLRPTTNNNLNFSAVLFLHGSTGTVTMTGWTKVHGSFAAGKNHLVVITCVNAAKVATIMEAN